MYSTCLHCQHDLGRNALIEHLPVGRRIAFDAATGRLWVVCPHCSRWNLVPFESRWEATEQAEKIYRRSQERMHTGEIGLARATEGTGLVRIGAPRRPEMSAWRYGAQMIRRRWRYATTVAPATILLLGGPYVTAVKPLLGSVVLPGYVLAWIAGYTYLRLIGSRTQGIIPLGEEHTILTRFLVSQFVVEPGHDGAVQLWAPIITTRADDDGFFEGLVKSLRYLRTPFMSREKREAYWAGTALLPTHYTRVPLEDHARVLRMVLPLLHEAGARAPLVREATSLLDDSHGDTRRLLFGGRSEWNVHTDPLRTIHHPRRLALEMLVHEHSEERWLSGEMLALEAEWRHATEIAEIADALLRDPGVEARLTAMRAAPPLPDT